MTEKVEPQEQLEGTCDGWQPYLRAKASWKAPSCEVNPYSSIGRVVSQLETPFQRQDPLLFFSEPFRFCYRASVCCFDC